MQANFAAPEIVAEIVAVTVAAGEQYTLRRLGEAMVLLVKLLAVYWYQILVWCPPRQLFLLVHAQQTYSYVASASVFRGGVYGRVCAFEGTLSHVRPGIAVRERRRCPLPGTGFYEVK